jgi:hypothetical protein
MPPRRLARTTSQKHELEAFAEKYDTLACIYGDPIEAVFAIMAKNFQMVKAPDGTHIFVGDDEVALRAAEMLMSYRYPRVKASEGQSNKAPVLNFNVSMPRPELEVNSRPVLAVVTEPPSE